MDNLTKIMTTLLLQQGVNSLAPTRKIDVFQNLTLYVVGTPQRVQVFKSGPNFSLVTFRTWPDMAAAGDAILLSIENDVEPTSAIPLARSATQCYEYTMLVSPAQTINALSYRSLGDLTVIEKSLVFLQDDPRFRELVDRDIKR